MGRKNRAELQRERLLNFGLYWGYIAALAMIFTGIAASFTGAENTSSLEFLALKLNGPALITAGIALIAFLIWSAKN